MMRLTPVDASVCAHEADVLDAVASGRLDPSRRSGAAAETAKADLQTHLATCASCRDLADVTRALFEERDAAWAEPAVPTAQVVWFRAQLRARAEAARMAARPVAVVQALGLACAVGAVAGVIGSGIWWLRSWATWFSDAALMLVSTTPSGVEMMGLAARGVLLAAAVWLVLAPVAVYLATDE